MDSRSTTPAPASSRLPTKKNSFHSLRDAKENININTNQRPLATSPTAVSDTSSVSDTAGFNAAAVNGNGNGAYGFGFDSRRSSTSSQQSDFRGRTSNGRPGQTRLPRPSPGAPATTTSTTKTTTAKTTTPGVAGNRRPLSIKDAFKMAEEEEAAAVAAAAQGSPSPAPRPWRNRAGGNASSVKGTPTPSVSSASAAAAARAMPMSASESRMQKILSNSPLDIGGRRTARRIGEPPTPTTVGPTVHPTAHQTAHQRDLSEESIQSLNSVSTAGRSERGSGVPDIRRIRYEEDQARLMVAMGERSGGLFSPKARVSPKIAVAGRELHRRASNSSLSDKSKVPVVSSADSSNSPRPSLTTTRSLLSSTASSRARTGSVLKRTSTAPAEAVSPRSARQRPSLTSATTPSPVSPIRPISKSATAPLLQPPDSTEPPLISSPGKNFAWNTDDDFTSDSLMVSNSPPVSTRLESPVPIPVGSPVSHTPAGNPPLVMGSPDLQPRNTKLDEIRQLEIDASLQFPDDSSGKSSIDGEPAPENEKVEKIEMEKTDEHPTRRPSLPAERQNKTLDEIRARENEGLSKRAISAAKLDEIRQRNAEFRTANLEAQPQGEQQPQELAQEERDAVVARVRARSVFEDEGDVNRGRKLLETEDNNSTASSDRETAKNKSISPALSRKSSSSTHSRTESQELLRKLARVTTSVAAVERKDKAPLGARRLREWFSSDNLREEEETSDKLDKSDKVESKSRGLPRLRDPDTLRPTVGFTQLRRVSSTDSAISKRLSLAQSDGDPLDRIEAEMKLFAAHGDQSERGSIRAPSPDSDGSKGALLTSASPGTVDDATPKASKIVNPLLKATPRVTGAYVETPITVKTEKMVPDEKEVHKAGDISGVFHKRQRSKSRSRSRSASRSRVPLVNSAKPTSARDDLLSIQRDQHMDDSTLDDFDTLMKSTESNDSVKKTDSASKTDSTNANPPRRTSQSEKAEKTPAEIMVTAISGSMEEFDKEITARLNRHHAERQLLLANNLKEETDVSDVDSIPPAPVVTKRKTHQRQSSSVTFKLEAKEAEKVVAKEAEVEEKPETNVRDFAIPETKNEKNEKNEKIPIPSITVTAPVSANVPVVSYLQIPLPKLYRSSIDKNNSNKKRLTFFGIMVLLFSVWFAVESTTCALYCRPESCQSGQACHWSPDDPSFGHAIPVKLDQWLTGGHGRSLWAWASEEVGDLLADAYDAATGTDIQQIDATYFSFDEKRRHRRRLQKRGLVQPWTPSPETRTKIDAWRRAREAREQEAAAAADVVRQRAAQVHEGEEYDIF